MQRSRFRDRQKIPNNDLVSFVRPFFFTYNPAIANRTQKKEKAGVV
jgi:hypothetical protein